MKIYLPGFALWRFQPNMLSELQQNGKDTHTPTNAARASEWRDRKFPRIWFCNHLQLLDLGEIYDLFAILPDSFSFIPWKGLNNVF